MAMGEGGPSSRHTRRLHLETDEQRRNLLYVKEEAKTKGVVINQRSLCHFLSLWLYMVAVIVFFIIIIFFFFFGCSLAKDQIRPAVAT